MNSFGSRTAVRLTLFIAALQISSAAFAASPATTARPRKLAILPPSLQDFAWFSDERFQAERKVGTDSGDRDPASAGELSETLFSDTFKSLRKKFLTVKTPEELDRFLVEVDTQYDTYKDQDAKFLILHLSIFRAYKSVFYRVRPFVSKTNVTHSFLLSMVRTVATATRVYLPTEQWSAGLRYLTEPLDPGVKVFANDQDIQQYLATELYVAVLKASARLQALDLKKHIIWDNQVLYGKASFQDDLDRYRSIGETERMAILSGFSSGLSLLGGALAYHWTEVLEVAQDLGVLFGVDGFLKGVEGASTESRVEVLMKHPDFLRLKTEQNAGPLWMGISFKHLQDSVRYGALAWERMKDRPASAKAMLDPAVFTPWTRQNNLTFAKLVDLIAGETVLRSAVTGEVVTVNLPEFYKNPPRDLKAFLPVAFEKGPKELEKTFGTGATQKKLRYRNYLHGRATGWDLNAFKPYFPSLKSGAEVESAARILSQSWGGFMLGGPLALVVL